MAVLEKIRVKFGILIAVLVAIALLSFILDPQTLRSAMEMLSSENKVGEMAGESISYKEFYEEYDHYQKVSEVMGQKANDEESQSALRDAAWQSIFDKQVFIPMAKKAGFNVCDQELMDLTQGSSISPVLLQQAMFYDENGNFSRERLASFVQSIDADPSGYSSLYWNFLEETIYRNQFYSKYGSVIEKSVIRNEAEKARLIADNNMTSDVDYVFVSLGYNRDSSIVVSPSEIRGYYNKHKKDMKQPANRSIEYVMFEVVPSTDDINAAREEFDTLAEEFKTTENVKNFIALNSDAKWDQKYYSLEQIQSIPEFAEYVQNPSSEISATHIEDNSFAAVKLLDVRTVADSARVFYKAFPLTEDAAADELVASLKKAPSTEGLSEMGWLTQDVLLANNLSELLPVVNGNDKVAKVSSTNNQAIFVVYVPERTKLVKKYQLANLLKNVLPSEETYRDFLMKATELSDLSEGKYQKFSEIVKEQNLPVTPANNIVEATRRIGVVDNAREVVRWAFEKKTKVGDVSDVIIVDNKYYFVAALTESYKEGTIGLGQVSSQISEVLYAEKAVEKKLAEVKEQISGLTSIEAVAEKLGMTVNHESGMAFGGMMNQNVDPKLLGAVAAAEQGEIKAIAGSIGVYVFDVVNRNEGSFYSEEDAKNAAARTSQYQTNMLQQVIAQGADIKDHRAKFF